MPLTPAQLAALDAELTAGHPTTGPYAADDEIAAGQLNAPNRQPNREATDAGTLVAAIVRAEYDALTTAQKDYLRLVISAGSAIPLTATLKTNLGALFPNPSGTRTNFLALQQRPGSRAEELGLGRVTESDVADARRLP